MLLRQLAGRGHRHRPTRSAVDVLASFAGRRFALWPPMRCWRRRKGVWLIVDEARGYTGSASPAAGSIFPTLPPTVQGYEAPVAGSC